MSTDDQTGSKYAVMVRKSANLSADRWSDERIATIKQMVAPQAKSVHEIAAFLAVCDKYGLDPILRQAWLGQVNGVPTVITGRDSYVTVAQRDPDYRGFDSGVVREKDEFALVREGDSVVVHHKMPTFKRGPIVGSFCVAYHARRRPVVITRAWEDMAHLTSKDVWKKNPEDMIETRSIVAALRRQYQISGLYTEADDGSSEGAEWVTATDRTQDATEAKMDDLKARMRASVAKQDPEPVSVVAEADEAISEAEEVPYEVVEEEGPTEQDFEEAASESEYSRANAEYHALCREVFGDDENGETLRREWQEQMVGKSSGKLKRDELKFLTVEIKKSAQKEALRRLEEGEQESLL